MSWPTGGPEKFEPLLLMTNQRGQEPTRAFPKALRIRAGTSTSFSPGSVLMIKLPRSGALPEHLTQTETDANCHDGLHAAQAIGYADLMGSSPAVRASSEVR